MIKKLLVISIIGMMVVLAGCGQNDNTTSQTDAQDASQKVTVALDYMPNTNHTGLYVALDKGFYKEEGLDVSIELPPEDGASALVASGKAQFGVDFQDLLAPAFTSDKPLPVTAVAALIQHNTSALMTLKEKNIDRPKKLEGKIYGTWNNPVELAMVKSIIEKDGGDAKALKTVPNSATDAIAALNTDMDAIWVYYAWDGIVAKEKGVDVQYMYFKDLNPVFDYYTPVLIANNDFLKNNAEIAKKFLKATEKGYQYACEHPDEAADILLAHGDGLDKNVVKASQEWLAKEYQGDAPQWGYIDPTRWNAFYEWLNQEKLVEKPLEKDFGFSNEYLPKK